ncbi:MAG: YbaB/EbfC family nucleoid-associated protein [Gammaproteobacteria bacterium]|nr:YbaB/EbfC family nucleoid-associated protein [Gammaproteobacteria bacterium]
MKGGFGDLMKQAQEMQDKVKEIQEQLEGTEVTGESGAGMVKVTMNGKHDVKKVDIDDSLMSEDKEVLEDLVAAAVNATVRRLEQERQDRMSELTAGLPLPPGFKLPF